MLGNHVRYAGGIALLAASTATGGCQWLADPSIEYVPCLPEAQPSRYEERFDDDWQYLRDYRCWRSANTPDPSNAVDPTIVSGLATDPEQTDPELLIRPQSAAAWSATSQAPLVFRQLQGNFAVFTRVETVSGRTSGTCLEAQDRAGLVVRSQDQRRWATFLTQPDVPAGSVCDGEDMPQARAFRESYGFAEDPGGKVSSFGLDGEADIALCRLNAQLLYYYRTRDEQGVGPWEALGDHGVDTDLLDVGVTVASSGNTDVEGHFPWLAILDELGTDGCGGAMTLFEAWEP